MDKIKMSLTNQLLFGSLVLGLCSLIHIWFLILTIQAFRRAANKKNDTATDIRWGLMLIFAFAIVLIAHTLQVWIWAAAFIALGALSVFDNALYFSLVTYTTLGYGDITVADGFRTFAAMAAVTGLLNFGLSTAFLVGFFSKFIEKFLPE